ncbi:MAG: dihydrolipoyl dehydrogenase [Bacteroidales bacterium]|nr:dihydrolipoyl dehydrogenase [Bacteroidales bacterium]MCF8350495.1 dihydrolipoyl dehydrogenase [Bacteroidales bacterium]MCF8377117.1 dihydrolipoyl dehydrogenase [Bacteroidales bacterium]MCF8401023.1 dihydrolipoyl dehydrogenase [Bacteroidales bacterium]
MADKKDKAQLVIIGAGPGGYAAAFHANDLGLDVTLIDPRENPGGVCLYEGCIPTKALLHFASTKEEAFKAKDWGLEFSNVSVDVKKVREWKEKVVKQLTGGLGQLSKRRKINFIRGTAKFKDKNTLEVDEHEGDTKELKFESALIATGARANALPGADFDHERIMSSRSALEMKDVPKELLVVGAGYIGLEMSVIYKALGSNICIVEMTSDIMPGIDKDLKDVFKKERKDLLDDALFETKVTDVKKNKKKLKVTLESKEGDKSEKEFDKMLVAIGQKPNSESIGLDKADVETDEQGFIKVDIVRKTNVENIYAIGDVAGQPMLAHKASHEGRVAVEAIAGKKTAYEPKAIPAVVFTEPEIAWTGLTEAEAKEQGRKVEVAKFPWGASGKAVAMGRNQGLTKLIIDPEKDRLLGAGFVGKEAGSLVPEATLAIEMTANAKDLALTIHPHPTLSETIMEAAEVYFGEPTHIYKPKRKK